MSNVKFILQRLKQMDYGALINKVNSISKKTGKSKAAVFLDMVSCARKHGAGYMDYDLYEMYNLTEEQRKTYMTRARSNEIYKKYNNPKRVEYLDDKTIFNDLFKDYIKRDWVEMSDPKEKVIEFLSKHEKFFAKPSDATGGFGIEMINTSDYESLDALYDYLLSLDQSGEYKGFELEEAVIQAPEISAIYPMAINTVRVVTLLKDKNEPHVICAYFRIGNNGNVVDNFHSDGMTTPVDVETGTVLYPAIDKKKNLYEVHPMTGAPIKGFVFPEWKEAIEMVKSAALVVPDVGYAGWDVAFSDKGPVLIEGNAFPGHDLYQLPEHTPDKIGMMPKFDI